MYRMKKTKIVATMSDFRCTEEFVAKLFDAGMDVIRINSAHVTEEGATRIVEIVHRVNPAIPIMIDTKGPEIRVTTIADEYGNSINFRTGDRVAVRGSDGSDLTTRKVVYMNVPSIVNDIPVGARMLIADGELEIRVVGKTDEELDCEFIVGGAMRSRKSVNVPGVSIALPSVTEKDRRFIEWAVTNDVDFIAHSFVRSARDIKAVQEILDAHGSNIKIISKIENQEGLDNIDEIIEASYGIMVARGDLGVELPAEVIPNTQRRIVEKCICAKRPVIIATQMTNLPIKYVVLDTKTGRTGRYLAAFRGRKTVMAVCYQLHAQRILALSYGVVPILRNQELTDRYHFLVDALEFLDQYKKLHDEDLLAIVGGSFGPDGGASYVEIANVHNIRKRNEEILAAQCK